MKSVKPDRQRSGRQAGGKTRGSVLLPVVAAMLILSLAGVALSELFGAQRMTTVHSVESLQAYWAAEAGLWHAAHENAAVATPVSFAGCSYTVSKSGSTFTATATRQNTTREAQFTFAGID